ncbi:DUF881 domain-containing protein [Cellulomonas hominis]
MSLLNDVFASPLDPGYRAAADRRAATGGTRRAPFSTRTVVLLVLVSVLGVGVTAAAVALRTPEPSAIAARTLLVDQITERGAEVDRLRSANAELGAEITAMQSAALQERDSALVDQLALDSAVSGATAVTGPGLRITLEDADVPDPESDPDSRVQDIDLQVVVNGLWASGAEAIAVNGQRLSATTAIRSAGSAILVDVVPLVGPYTIEAIGDPSELQTRLARTSAGQHMATLGSTYGIGVTTSAHDELDLPGTSVATLGSARLPDGVEPVPEPTDRTPPPGDAASDTLSQDPSGASAGTGTGS